jgi:hypothetical protein
MAIKRRVGQPRRNLAKSVCEFSLRGPLSWHHTRSRCHLARVALEQRCAPAARQPFPEPVQFEEITVS